MELALSISEHSRIGLPGHGSPENGSAKQSPVQLDLLPYTSDYSHASQLWLSLAPENGNNSENRSSGQMVSFDVNEIPSDRTDEATVSSPNSHTMNGKRDWESETETERASSRCSDEEGGLNRKKLRLSKDQSTYLEETFKQHNTLNPKQKVGLAKLLNLRPRQVEVWFQNRRARTKFKQTEVDREYLKRCCESLTEENRRLQKELVELKALKSATPSYRLQPATTLTICASCERAATTATGNIGNSGSLRVPKPCFIQFP